VTNVSQAIVGQQSVFRVRVRIFTPLRKQPARRPAETDEKTRRIRSIRAATTAGSYDSWALGLRWRRSLAWAPI